jgi:hypothetical protein
MTEVVTVHDKGVLAGTRLQPRTVAGLAVSAGWTGLDLYRAVAICGGESAFYTEAHNDNLDANGVVVSRDVGLMEINIPASQIGTASETDLYDPTKNFARAFKLWQSRGWQPWVAYNTNAYLADTYRVWALLGVQSYYATELAAEAKAAGKTSVIKVPLFSLIDLRKKYPGLYLW